LRSVRRVTFFALLLGLVALAATATAGAGPKPPASPPPPPVGSDCGSTSQPFTHWGDSSNYYFPGDAGFENGGSGWTLAGGAAVVGGNETFNLHSATDSHSLLIPAGGSATTTVCIGLFYPYLRLLAVGQGSTVTVTLIPTNNGPVKALAKLDGGSFKPGSSWAPSPQISTKLSSVTSPAGGRTVQVQISASHAAAQIDDLYVDPFVLKR
jgi:hypothetical protein